jgi:alanyl-tRNA synthetase
MQILENKWFVPLLAMFIALGVSTARLYTYIDGVLTVYARSFYVENKDNYVYWTFHTRELQQIISSLRMSKEDMDHRQDELNALNERLEQERRELKSARTQLESYRQGITSLITESQASEMKNLKTLASTYTAMDPEAAVAVLNELDETTVVKILALMKADTVGSLFDVMAKVPGKESQNRTRIARLSEKLRLFKQSQN